MAEQREMKEKNPWHSPLIICVAVFIALGIITLVTTAVVQNKPIHQKYKYGIVLDAGSSHTAVFIYEWPAEKENNTGMVRQKHQCTVKGKGISSYASNARQAGVSLKECMREATQIVPFWRHRETPVYLGATAGMRLLREENVMLSDKVLTAVEESLRSQPFTFQGARILTGQEEGAFGWITVNYLKDNFRKQASRTLGALDLGGASTQITFVSKQPIQSPNNSIDFRLYGKDYHLYTHSFLCYGKDQVLKQFLAQQLKGIQTSGAKTVEDPCFHPGYKFDRSFDSVYKTPCVKSEDPRVLSGTFAQTGAGNWAKCRVEIKKVFNFDNCPWSQCSFNKVFQPPVEGTFMAFSAFYFVMDFLNLTSNSLEDIKVKLDSYCATPWEQVVRAYPTVKEKYLSEYCFSGTYIITLLEEGYKFTSENWQDIKFTSKIGNSDAGWTLGYMLNLTNMIPAEAPDTPPLPYGGYVSIMVFTTLLLLGLFFVAYIFFGRPRCMSPKEII